jgi:hypothetical protein
MLEDIMYRIMLQPKSIARYFIPKAAALGMKYPVMPKG